MTSKQQASEWAYHLKRTGHHKLNTSDFGFWHCEACGKNGDDWESPKDFECVELDTTEDS